MTGSPSNTNSYLLLKTRLDFFTLLIYLSGIDSKVVDKWLDMSQTLQDWTKPFCLAKMALESEDFEAQEDIMLIKDQLKVQGRIKPPVKRK